MTKSELFKFAHSIAKLKSVAFYGSYQKAFGAVLRDLYAQGYADGGNAFQIVEPSYKRAMYSRGVWVSL
jgi:hypothetical protein